MSTEFSPATAVIAWEAPDPEAAFARLQGRRGVFWLDSSLPSAAGRYSCMGAEPFGVFRARGDESEWRIDGRTERTRGDPLARLAELRSMYRVSHDANRPGPFSGGAVGFLAYDLGRPEGAAPARDGAPDLHFAWYDAAAVWDHAEGRAWLVGAGWRRPPAAAAAELAAWLEGATAPPAPPPAAARPVWRGDFTRAAYLAAVERVRARIAAGEIYQMNLAQRFTCPLPGPPPELYRRLRRLNPAPMGAYFDAGDRVLLSSSPERFIEVADGRIRTFPIKGTRPRGRTPEEDAARRRELAASEKERAELLMIVDLLRNDLGRVCRFGSVRVRRLHALESFATVHHLVGEVEGELRPEVGTAELLRAVFPGGSITGAPKVRAMQVIDAEEPVRRGIFAGALGYFSACGRIDLNIAIRTIECHGGEASFHVGAGIVWDSDPAGEYEETLAKGEALFAALGGEAPAWRSAEPGPRAVANGRLVEAAAAPAEPAEAQGVFETVLLRGGQPVFFAEHAARYAAGCARLGLERAPGADELRARAAELARINDCPEGVLRWSAWTTPDGAEEWRLTVAPPRLHAAKSVWRAAVAAIRLPPPGPAAACKLLDRRLGRDVLAAARARGCDDALLADRDGRIVESCLANVFCVSRGTLRTPPLESGALPGIVRAKVLALAGDVGCPVAEETIPIDSLLAAEEVFLTNSLIGLKPVTELEGHSFPAPGPVTARLQSAWRHLYGWG